MRRHNKAFYIFLIIIAFFSFYFRFRGLHVNLPFWVDEFSTANQARIILEHGLNVFGSNLIHFESHNALFHFIIAIFYKLFGQSESVTRLPSALVGSFIPVLLFLLGVKIFNLRTGIAAGLLSSNSYFLITWSRQARSYVFLQFFILAAVYLYIKITQRKEKSFLNIFLLFLSAILGLFTHSLFYIFLTALGVHYVMTHLKYVSLWKRNPLFYIAAAIVLFISYFSGFLSVFFSNYIVGGIIKSNNIWYYHSFLWREYSLITYLSLLGLFFTFVSKRKIFFLIFIYLSLHLTFINLLFAPYVSRYLLPIWPFILLLSAYSLSNMEDSLSGKFKLLQIGTLTVIFTLAIIVNGYKFTIKPRSFYSVNHDFREIAIIDYHQVYGVIKEKGDLDEGKTAVIDTWYDRLYWYLGRDFQYGYLFRWINEEGTTNGLVKKTDFDYNKGGEKIVRGISSLGFIGELKDLEKAMKKYPKGFIFIDDSSMPKDVINYAEKKFKKELYLDHYPLDDNPYSIWPATLYSWGFGKT